MNYPYYTELSKSHDSIILIDKLDTQLISQAINGMISTYELKIIETNRETYLANYNWEKEVLRIRDIYGVFYV